MSKKSSVKNSKKSKRRLKRSVRRTLAAVLMITAIGVAAIPVPENLATGNTLGEGEGEGGNDDEIYTASYSYPSGNDKLKEVSLSDSQYTIIDIGDGAGQDTEYQSCIIRPNSKGWRLSWQFKFVMRDTKGEAGGMVSDYNNNYVQDDVELDTNVIYDYAIIDQSEFSNYFTTGEDAEKEYICTKPGLGNDCKFIQKYFKEDYDAFVTAYNDFVEKNKDINYDGADYNSEAFKDLANKPIISKTIKEMKAQDKFTYYCDNNEYKYTPEGKENVETIDLYGCTLVEVINALQESGESEPSSSVNDTYVYIPMKTDDYTGPWTRFDGNNFMYINTSPIIGIGDEAFKGVGNVDYLTLPKDIKYIGKSAFEGSFIKSISFDNVEQIGNYAFKNCRQLETIKMGGTTRKIGTEAFYGTILKSVVFPYGIDEIGPGAFAYCHSLSNVDFSAMTGNNIRMGDYAFYDDYSLSSLNFISSKSGATVGITTIGDCAFALSPASSVQGGGLTVFTFPTDIDYVKGDSVDTKDLSGVGMGDFVLAGRTTLKNVTMPAAFGVGTKQTVPDNLFYNCRNLDWVTFPESCVYAEYNPDILFCTVSNESFYVRGPKANNAKKPALPRKSTWKAKIAVDGVKVPYVYNENGKDYYEVSDGDYLMCIDSVTGVLQSCSLRPDMTSAELGDILDKGIDLEIPAKVGNTKVTGIASNCFTDNTLNQAVKTLTIADDSISTINNNVFKGWKTLEKVFIGDSVSLIGNEAFADCSKLEDVTFNTSSRYDYSALKIGDNAFKTGSRKLTFHGVIEKGYAPFDWAMDKNNVLDSEFQVRVCYKSLSPTYLTVMYDASTDYITLLDYPKYDQLNNMPAKSSSYKNHNGEMEAVYYAQYRSELYDYQRQAFANRLKLIEEGNTNKTVEDLYKTEYYGPWITPEFCSYDSDAKKYVWETYVTGDPVTDFGGNSSDNNDDNNNDDNNDDNNDNNSGDNNEQSHNTLVDWLFEPIVAYAADVVVKPYFSTNPYDVIANYEMGTDLRPDYKQNTPEELAWINATRNLVVPAGIKSIDVAKFMNADVNQYNVTRYFNPNNESLDQESYDMYFDKTKGDKADTTETVPGLFSGYYNDYTNASDKETYEKFGRGNDRIQTITLTDVEYLPDFAFDSCEQLTIVELGPNCKDIGTTPFRGCTSLKTVGSNNYYKINNGIVYSVNPDGSYTIEECLSARGMSGGVGEAQIGLSTDEDLGKVSLIKEGAFEDCDNITLVDLTNTAGLLEIPKRCFKNCDNLNRVWLPSTVNSIDDEAFVGANQLKDLQIPGKEVFISGHAFDENKAGVTTVYTSEDSSARRYVDTYGKRYKLEWQKKDNWRVIFLDADLNQIGKEQIVDDGAYAEIPEAPVKDDWIFERWLGTNNADPKNPITADTTFVAVGYSTSSMVDGKYKVDFMDQVDGKIFSTQLVEPGGNAIIPQAPVHAGYTFLKYGGDSLTNIQKNSIALAMYSGGTNTGTGSGGNGGNGGNGTTSGSSSSTQSSDSVSGSSASTTSTGAGSVGKYTVTVINGNGSGTYDAGTTVIIAANTPATGKVFKNWTTESAGVTFASVSLSATTFVMPNNNVTVTANYVNGSGNSITGVSTNGNTGNNNNNGGTRVDITKPGISNKDLATANVNGSTDNFVVKISETPEATQAVVNALTNKYGNLDSVLYYAMDISLYDSTGSVKISDTTGLTVDITIPIPDALTVFGGNNMAGAVVAGNQLEDLSERFSTINGVPCISFTATHFSPYTIYVNTQQLSDGALDITPKTGDPIHPKWFLSLGLACLSIILFMKKDKKPVKVKAA